MAMSKGSVTINPDTGADSGTGAAYEVFQTLDAAQDYGPLEGEALASAKQQVADISEAVSVMIDHIKNNAEVSTTVASGIEVEVEPLTGVGETTGTGTGAGTVT